MAEIVWNEQEQKVFKQLLDFLGVELKCRGIGGCEPDRNDASCNGLYFYSKSGRFLYEKTSAFSYLEGWNMGDEKTAAEFLLEDCIGFSCFRDEFSYSRDEDSKPIQNPFFGCCSLEEAAVKLDLLGENKERESYGGK